MWRNKGVGSVGNEIGEWLGVWKSVLVCGER